MLKGDVTSTGDVRRMAREIEDHYGRIDVLVNNAGSMVERATLAEMTEEVWDRVMDVNLKSVYLCSQAVLPDHEAAGRREDHKHDLRLRQGRGQPQLPRLLDGQGRGQYPDQGHGQRPRRRRHKGQRGRPRTHRHPVSRRVHHGREKGRGRAEHPAREREGAPEEVVGAVLFLASSQADYIIGEIIEVNGGMLMD